MVRTKADAATARVSGAKAPRKLAVTQPTDKKRSSSSGGNPYCPRETPAWQKEITAFFPKADSVGGASTSAKAEATVVSSTSKEPEKEGGVETSSQADGLCDRDNENGSANDDNAVADRGASCSQDKGDNTVVDCGASCSQDKGEGSNAVLTHAEN